MSAPDPDSLKLVYWDEINKVNTLLSYKFKEVDAITDGMISLQHFKNIVRGSKQLTPKEKNLLIRLQKNDMIKYSEFPDMLYNVRFEIAMSEMMEYNIDNVGYDLRKEFSRYDKDDSKTITIHQAQEALQRCKKLSLTPFQIHILMGLSDCDGDGMVPYIKFTEVCVSYVKDNFQFNQLIRKKELAELNAHKISRIHPAVKHLDEMELFRTFKKYDRNSNGTLSFTEYAQCLAEC